MEELIFFAVIIIFSILESIARSRKAKQQGGEAEEDDAGGPEWEAELPDLGLPTPGRTSDDDVPTYDEEPSYDDITARQRREAREREREGGARTDRPLDGYRAPHGTDRPMAPSTAEAPKPQRPSSETMLPGDLLEQLETLAQGRRKQRTEEPREGRGGARPVDLPTESPPPTPIEQREVGSGRRPSAPVGSTAPVGSRTPIGATSVEHEIHRSHAGYGTDPSTRARSEQDGLDPLAERLDADGVEVRRLLLGGGRPALRAAMVLKEVLGPPLTLRDEGGHPASATSPPAPSS